VLHRAACQPHRLAVQAILDFSSLSAAYSSLINQRDGAGRNALHWVATTAEGYDKQAVIRALLEAGCDATLIDSEGRDVPAPQHLSLALSLSLSLSLSVCVCVCVCGRQHLHFRSSE
jgi:ankyrin repeat protein